MLVAALALITGTVSYLHALWVVRAVGNAGAVAFLCPAVPDLMIVTSSVTLLEAVRQGARRPWQAMLALGVGASATVVMNVAAGWHDGWGGSLVAGLIPVAFILTFETLLVLFRIWRDAPLTTDSAAACGHKVATTRDEAIVAAVKAGLSHRAAAKGFEVSHTYVGKVVATVATPAEVATATVPDPSLNGSASHDD